MAPRYRSSTPRRRPAPQPPTSNRPTLRSRRSAAPSRTITPNIDRYLADIREFPSLDREEEVALAKRVQAGDERALSELVESNLRFVVKIAGEYRHFGLAFEDLVNEGNLGLIEAARRFDPERGTRFITLAVWWIRKAICRALSEDSQVVRLPVSQLRKMRVVRSVEKALAEDLGREPSRDELTRKLPKEFSNLDPIHRYGLRMSSLDDPVTEGRKDTFAESLCDETQDSIETDVAWRECGSQLRPLLESLDARQRRVLIARFGLDGQPPRTLGEIGKELGRSREGVRLIERKALMQLRRDFDGQARPIAVPA